MKQATRRLCLVSSHFFRLQAFVVPAIGLVLGATSCISPKNVTYFQNLNDSQVVHLPVIKKDQAVIMPEDMLDIKIAGANEATSNLMNAYSTNIPGQNATGAGGYTVDNDGFVAFPYIGKVKAAGLTRTAFTDTLRNKVAKYLKEPQVAVRFTNFRFTILGEVKTPGSFLVPNERVTILDALGMAGDMTTYSNRRNVRIIRDSSGNREIATLDFTDKALLMSKYYYLQRNDVIYIEQHKAKSEVESVTKLSAIAATIASLVAVTVAILR